MIKKFEIKSHDGPGRIGKIDGDLTPKLFYKNDLKIAPSEGSAHNVDREIAEFNVKETLRLAEENVDECDIAVIQGSKYIDLRVNCLKQLEEIGYNGFIIANGDALLTNSKDLVEIIVALKKEAKKSSYFIFPFTEEYSISSITLYHRFSYLSRSFFHAIKIFFRCSIIPINIASNPIVLLECPYSHEVFTDFNVVRFFFHVLTNKGHTLIIFQKVFNNLLIREVKQKLLLFSITVFHHSQ